MRKQKVCIIGGGLSGLITAITLSKLNLEIDLITRNYDKSVKSSRTIAISQNNYNFLKELNIFKFSKKIFWPSYKIKLYTENKKKNIQEIFEFKKEKKEILYMFESAKIEKLMINYIKKNKSISLKNENKITNIDSSGLLKKIKLKNNFFKYNLIILCTGNNSDLVKNIFKDEVLEHFYEEASITATFKHNFVNNNIARQIFLDEQILALLPISNTKTSFVWTVKKKFLKKYKKNNLLFKKKIEFYIKDFFTKIQFNNNIEYKNLNFLIRKKYYQDRILLFGDALHAIHPFVGQGFNMVLRDLISLEKTLKNKIALGLDLGNLDILSEFSNETKPSNFIYSISVDFLKSFFSYKNNYFKEFRNKFLVKLNKNSYAKNIFFDFANKGFRF